MGTSGSPMKMPRYTLRIFFFGFTMIVVAFGGWRLWRDNYRSAISAARDAGVSLGTVAERETGLRLLLSPIRRGPRKLITENETQKWLYEEDHSPFPMRFSRPPSHWRLLGSEIVVKAELPSGHIDDLTMESVSNIHTIDVLRCNDSELSAAGWNSIGDLDRLVELSLLNMGSDGKDLSFLSRLRNLQTLDLSGTSVSDRDLDHIVRLKGLTTLRLYGTAITGPGIVRMLPELPQLQELGIGSTNGDSEHRIEGKYYNQLRAAMPACRVNGWTHEMCQDSKDEAAGEAEF
ncbi:MAG: hypothetical protein ACI9G1_002935 [Pirellulaceae bacterium]|jgi:hypothetical protein